MSNSFYWSLIDRYLYDLRGSTFYNPVTQYYDTINYIHNNSTFSAAVTDSRAYPVHNGYIYTTDADIRAEVVREIKLQGWTYGLHSQFFVYTARNILTWDGKKWSNNGTNGGFCAYHWNTYGGSYGLQNVPIVYANMPSQDGHWSCAAHPNGTNTYYAPNGDYTADGAVSTTSHEQMEMITDPIPLSGWTDSAGDENGDKCAYVYGGVASDGANVVMNGHRYILQGEWSNALGTCAWYRAYPYH